MPSHLTGVTKTMERITRQMNDVSLSTRRELIEFCEALAGLAAQYAPVDQGDLRGSFVVIINGEQWLHTESGPDGSLRVIRDRTDVPEGITSLEIYVGTAGCVYALRQHEELTWNHPKGGYAKFMEKAYDEIIGTLQQRLDEAKRRGLNGGTG